MFSFSRGGGGGGAGLHACSHGTVALCYHSEMLSFLLLSLLSSVVFAGFSAESLRARIEDGRYYYCTVYMYMYM